jgi:poly-gamma-glutamate capsule biosynthesis protein CapA/YwtB (metallophosphatase superfamily)
MRLGLAGDTMLGRGVAAELERRPPETLFSDDVLAAASEADAVVLNLECCVSEGGRPWPDPGKPFFFRAPPVALDALVRLGVRCVTLANNHALDFGEEALLDTFDHLTSAGIAWVGAGADLERARAPVTLDLPGVRLGVVGVTDHPAAFAAASARPGVAYADLRRETPAWLLEAAGGDGADAVLVTPHWGPNMTTSPVPHVRRAAAELRQAGAALVAGHSAHAFHGVGDRVLYDIGDFLDDYRTDPVARNDLGLFFLVDFDGAVPVRLEAVPLTLEYARTDLAAGNDAAWIRWRFRQACAGFGTQVTERAGRLVVDWPTSGA